MSDVSREAADDVSRETTAAPASFRGADGGRRRGVGHRLRRPRPPRWPGPPSTPCWPGSGARLRPPLPAARARPGSWWWRNQKGGVGKTTSTVNIAAALAQLGQRVLVDRPRPPGQRLDGAGRRAPPRRAVDVRRAGRRRPARRGGAAECPEVENLFVVPATIDLAGAEIELVSVVARESRLRKAIHGHPQVGVRRRGRRGPLRLRAHRLPAVAGAADPERAGGRRRDADPDPGGVLRARGPRPAARDRRDGPRAPQPAAARSPRSWSRCTTPAPGSPPASPTRCASTSATRC